MKPPAPRPKPTFLWQALLILLPMVLLTLAGFWALRQDRRLVEQDARERAVEVLRALSPFVEQTLRFGLVDGDLRVSSDDPESISIESLRFFCRWDADGHLIAPPDYKDPPAPAPWWSDLTSAQRTAWDKALLAGARDAAEPDPEEALAGLLKSEPAESAGVAAQFELLRARFLKTGEADAAGELLAFARAHSESTSATGLPLAALAAATLLTHRQAAAQDNVLVEALRTCVLESPSALTPLLLRQASEASRDNPPERTGELAELRKLWTAQSRLRQLAHALANRVPAAQESGCAWLESEDRAWLAVFGPGHDEVTDASTNPPVAPGRTAWFVLQRVVEHALARALNSRRDSWPAFARLRVDVAGRTWLPPRLDSVVVGDQTSAPVLAEAQTSIDRLAFWHAGEVPGKARRQSEEFLDLPAAIPLHFTLHLTDPESLYSRQTQRAWLFGGLLAVAAGAAMIGLLGAYRAFQRQLKLADLKSNFVSSVSHELRAPIASVRLLAESLERGKITDEPKRQDYFRLIGQECRRLSGLIDNVLDFSRIDQGRKRYEFEPTDLRALVQQTVDLMEPYAAERSVPLELEAPANAVELVGDGRALQQALVNLLDNALKHSPAGSPVRIALAVTPAGIRLSVADAGPGIPAEDRERIFEPFFRRGSELRRETQGTGIGLSIVRHVITAHGGRVQVESATGQGACFTVELPAPSERHEH